VTPGLSRTYFTDTNNNPMRYIRSALFVAIIWLLLSGHYTTLILSLGVLSVLTVTWFVWRMDRADGELAVLPMRPRLLYYLLWLMWQVVLSNIDLVRRIWDPSLPIRPTWQRLDIRVTSPLAKMLYANSITLTPGTLTTNVREDHFMVHSLTSDGIEELRKGDMERQIQRLGI
jgi:multicomponent Na+:H+ antiporter subunit E